MTPGQGPGPGQNKTVTQLAVQIVNTPEPSIRTQFDANLPTGVIWAGCQRVTQQVHL
jgi:hypothetical protein